MDDQICRLCSSKLTASFIDLGVQPLSNSYIPLESKRHGEIIYPLHAYVCTTCFLVQLEEFESPSAIFSNYSYFSSYSTSWLAHSKKYALQMIERYGLTEKSLVIEIASNDGYLLRFFKEKKVRVRGVEPAANVASVAIANGIDTDVNFFNIETATRMKSEGLVADLMVANNVLAHIPNITDFMLAFSMVLKAEGVATFEFPHLLRQIEGNQFDQIYHEHFSYLSLLVVNELARRSSLRVFDVEELETHGGSLRVFVCHDGASYAPTINVANVLNNERAAKLNVISGYEDFEACTREIKLKALEFLIQAKRDGKVVCGYGAAAKGNTFLNFIGAGPDLIAGVADRSPHKQHKLLPGSRIPVISPKELDAMQPDFIIILPWNIRAEIEQQLQHVREWGCRFVQAIPHLQVF